jgi:hypothetical protein
MKVASAPGQRVLCVWSLSRLAMGVDGWLWSPATPPVVDS